MVLSQRAKMSYIKLVEERDNHVYLCVSDFNIHINMFASLGLQLHKCSLSLTVFDIGSDSKPEGY